MVHNVLKTFTRFYGFSYKKTQNGKSTDLPQTHVRNSSPVLSELASAEHRQGISKRVSWISETLKLLLLPSSVLPATQN